MTPTALPFRCTSTLGLGLLLLGTAGGAARAQDRATLIARLDSIARAPVQEGRAAGISVAVVRGSDTLLLRGYGKANIELDVAMPALGTLMRSSPWSC